ncbi:MAG: chloride channel protein [Magnetospiraceae bacterium]
MKAHRIMMLVRRFVRNDQLILVSLALVVGSIAGLLVTGFRYLILGVQWLAFGTGDEFLASHADTLPEWRIVLAPVLGGLLVGYLLYRIMPGGRPQGIADVMEAAALNRGRMSAKAGIGAALCSALSLGSGASLGREGPAVHLGAAFCAYVAEKLRLTRQLSRTLLGCGAAAAVAASFNAPIAGALFATEVIVGHYAVSAFAPIVIASVTGTVVSRAFFGDFPAFAIPPEATDIWEFPIFAAMGLAAGGITWLLIQGTGLTQKFMNQLPGPVWPRPALGGLAVGLIALAFPQVLGVGYEGTIEAISGAHALGFVFALALAKIAATAISAGSGFAGGVFSPALMIGATLGSALGLAMTGLLPWETSGISSYAAVGMGAMASAMLGAPISTTLIIFELTSDYALTMAVMVAAVLGSITARQLGCMSFFSWQLGLRDIDLVNATRAMVLRNITAKDCLSQPRQTVAPGTNLQDLRIALMNSESGHLFVLGADNRLFGTVSLADLHEAAFDRDLDHLVNATDVAWRNPPMITPEDTLEAAVNLMTEHQIDHLAVVADPDSRQFLGGLRERDALAAENDALIKLRREER